MREQCWYDTALPDGGRSAAVAPAGFQYPVMGDMNNYAGKYKLWLNEVGTDRVDIGGTTTPIRKYFETGWLGGPKQQQPSNQGLSTALFEPDIIQTGGDMSVYLIGQSNSRSPQSVGNSETLKFIPSVSQEQVVGFKESHRYTKLHVESNTLGGSYIVGHNLLHVQPSENRIVS